MSNQIDIDNEIQIKDLNKKNKALDNDLLMLDDPLTSVNAITYKNFYEQIRESTYKDLPKLLEYLEKQGTIEDLKKDTSLKEIELSRTNIPTGRNEIVFFLDYKQNKITPITLKTFAYKIYKHLFGVSNQPDSDKTASFNTATATSAKSDDFIPMLTRENGTLFKMTQQSLITTIKDALLNTSSEAVINMSEDSICFFEKGSSRITVISFAKFLDTITTKHENNADIDTSYENIAFYDTKNFRFTTYKIDALGKALRLGELATKVEVVGEALNTKLKEVFSKANNKADWGDWIKTYRFLIRDTRDNDIEQVPIPNWMAQDPAIKINDLESKISREFATKSEVTGSELQDKMKTSLKNLYTRTNKSWENLHFLLRNASDDDIEQMLIPNWMAQDPAIKINDLESKISREFATKSEVTGSELKAKMKTALKDSYNRPESSLDKINFLVRNTSDNDIEQMPIPVWLRGVPSGFGGYTPYVDPTAIGHSLYQSRAIEIILKSSRETVIELPNNTTPYYIYLDISVGIKYDKSLGEQNNVKYVYTRFGSYGAKWQAFRFDAWGQKSEPESYNFTGHSMPLYQGWYQVGKLDSGKPQLLKC
ncbi:DUF685 domain-containing protein [Candidatus Borreliella tachyglossi]|uniref:DUF685 domain-containing protein n=1 Tax=Candidatus Borreliella tachyglossi TaxID=1964448 RepID=UPI004042F393